MRPSPLLIAAVCVIVTIGMSVTPASAHDIGPGRDISFPQCGMRKRLPANAQFGVVGVNGGRVFTRNPCLAEQLGWAKTLSMPPAFYANTGNPGPALARVWPLGQTVPFECSAAEPNSLGCSFDYGWNAAKDSFEKALDGAQEWNGYDRATAAQRVANVDWWLDVEILNSWQTLPESHRPSRAAARRDAMALIAALFALWDAGAQRVGIYSTSYQWHAITGGEFPTMGWFSGIPVWLAGYDDHEHATRGCNDRSFTGGPVVMTQYLGADGLDANVWCG